MFTRVSIACQHNNNKIIIIISFIIGHLCVITGELSPGAHQVQQLG